MQAIEDDLNKLQVNFQSGIQLSDRIDLLHSYRKEFRNWERAHCGRKCRRLQLTYNSSKKGSSGMKDFEHRLKQSEENIGNGASQQTMQELKEKFHPVMTDIEKRLIALEIRPVEPSISNVSFMEENPTTLTTSTERVQILESRVNNMEPSLSTLHSSISSTPLEPPEEHRRREGLSNESSSSGIPARPMPPLIPTSTGAFNYTMGELENRLLKRIQALESQLVQLGTQELPVRQRDKGGTDAHDKRPPVIGA